MLSIGQFSKVCSVSVQTLRYYDQIHLITPCKVNSDNGYRYYDVSQIPIVLLISRLKRYGFSLEQIQKLLRVQEKEHQIELLLSQKEILDNDISVKQLALEELEKHIQNMKQGEDIMSYPEKYKVQMTERDPQPIYSLRQMMGVEDFGKYFGLLFEKMAKEHIAPAGKTMAIYHDEAFNHEHTDIEIAVPVADKANATRILDGGEFAYTIHYGSYSTLSDAYGAITEWIDTNGYQVVSAPFEIYDDSNMSGLPIEKWKTSVYFPVSKKA